MHSSASDSCERPLDSSDVLVAIAALVTEGRIPDKLNTSQRGYSEGPHCSCESTGSHNHSCDTNEFLCSRYEKLRSQVLALWQKAIPLCIEVLLTSDCECGQSLAASIDFSNVATSKRATFSLNTDVSLDDTGTGSSTQALANGECVAIAETLLLEQWYINVEHKRSHDWTHFTTIEKLIEKIRSQLQTSQLASWFSVKNDDSKEIRFPNQHKNIIYRLTIPGETIHNSKYDVHLIKHNFPVADMGDNKILKLTVNTLPQTDEVPVVECLNCKIKQQLKNKSPVKNAISPLKHQGKFVDDRMPSPCSKNGKHKCTYGDLESDLDELNLLEAKRKIMKRSYKPKYVDTSNDKSINSEDTAICMTEQSDMSDLRRRLDFEEFMRNQPSTSTKSMDYYFAVPSTSSCVHNNIILTSNNSRQTNDSICKKCTFSNDHTESNSRKISSHSPESQELLECDNFNKRPNLNTQFFNTSSAKMINYGSKNKSQRVKCYCDKMTQTSDLDCLSQKEFKEILTCLNSHSTPSAKLLNNADTTDLTSNNQSKSDILLNAILRSSKIQNKDGTQRSGTLSNIGNVKSFIIDSNFSGNLNSRNQVCGSETRDSSLGDISECKCDIIMNDKKSDNDYISSYKLYNKDFIYVDKQSICDMNAFVKKEKIKDISNVLSNGRRHLAERRKGSNTVKNLKMDIDTEKTSLDSKVLDKKTMTSPIKLNDELKSDNKGTKRALIELSECPKQEINFKCFEKSGHSMLKASLLAESRKKLYRNSEFVETKRKIDFSKLDSTKCVEKASNNSDSTQDSLDLSNACTEANDEFDQLDQECENFMSNIPSVLDKEKFRKSFDNAASMVFHSRTGLPLTSSPAPIRKGKKCFDYDSDINSVSAISSALFDLEPVTNDEDSESDCTATSPCSPDIIVTFPIPPRPLSLRRKYAHNGSSLLGSFEESVLNGRLEPVSTVQGFMADIGASGSFSPAHKRLPVTVFFYTLGDIDKLSTPYLGHINLGKKGYNVPKKGTIQVSLFNPMGSVVKMFVILYDLSDMPSNSQTFIRQRTLYMPTNCEVPKNIGEGDSLWGQKYLRYLIHLRFMSSKSGRIYLHTDIRMIIFRKSDMDTATAHINMMSYELRSFLHSPTNPKFSPRK